MNSTKQDKFQITLAAARVNAGMKQKEVAQIMHISNRTLINWESGKISPSIANLEMLCRLYKAPIDYIFLPNKST